MRSLGALVHDLNIKLCTLVGLSYKMALTLRKIVDLGVCTKDGDETCTCEHCHLAKEASVLLEEYEMLKLTEEHPHPEHLG